MCNRELEAVMQGPKAQQRAHRTQQPLVAQHNVLPALSTAPSASRSLESSRSHIDSRSRSPLVVEGVGGSSSWNLTLMLGTAHPNWAAGLSAQRKCGQGVFFLLAKRNASGFVRISLTKP